MGKIHYYELCFYHDEDDDMATSARCSYCIKTEIPPVISDEIALRILFGEQPTAEDHILMENLTCVMEISEDEAYEIFDMSEFTIRVEDKFGIYYKEENLVCNDCGEDCNDCIYGKG